MTIPKHTGTTGTTAAMKKGEDSPASKTFISYQQTTSLFPSGLGLCPERIYCFCSIFLFFSFPFCFFFPFALRSLFSSFVFPSIFFLFALLSLPCRLYVLNSTFHGYVPGTRSLQVITGWYPRTTATARCVVPSTVALCADA